MLFQSNLKRILSDCVMTWLCIGIVVLSIFVIHLVNGAQFLNATCVACCPIIVISPVAKM